MSIIYNSLVSYPPTMHLYSFWVNSVLHSNAAISLVPNKIKMFKFPSNPS